MLGSVAAVDGSLCVDVFTYPNGGFGFEHFRSDVEDAGRWTAIGGWSGRRYDSLSEAITSAEQAIQWLADNEAWSTMSEHLLAKGPSSQMDHPLGPNADA